MPLIQHIICKKSKSGYTQPPWHGFLSCQHNWPFTSYLPLSHTQHVAAYPTYSPRSPSASTLKEKMLLHPKITVLLSKVNIRIGGCQNEACTGVNTTAPDHHLINCISNNSLLHWISALLASQSRRLLLSEDKGVFKDKFTRTIFPMVVSTIIL